MINKKEIVYDFSQGKLAKFLEKNLDLKIKQKTNGGYFEPLTFDSYEIKKLDNNYYLEKGEDFNFVFAYLKHYETKKYGLPKYHIYHCETRKEYQSFEFSNCMPVNIISKDENKTYNNCYLELCKNCSKEIVKSTWGSISNLNWYDVIIKKANETTFTDKDLKSDGYIKSWKQLSEAYREKMNYVCEECKINLSKDKYYLEVHHIDQNRLNNKENNLKSLCVKCHSHKHPNNYNSGLNLLKVNEFTKKYYL